MPFYQLKKEEKRVTFEYVEANNLKEAKEKFEYGNTIEYVQEEMLSDEKIKIEEVETNLETLKDVTKKIRITKLSEKVAKNKTTKDSYVLVKQEARMLKIGDVVECEKNFYEVYLKTKEEVFLKNAQEKVIIRKSDLIDYLKPIREYIKKEKPYECLITFNIKEPLVDRLTQFDDDALTTIKKLNKNLSERDVEEFWVELTEKSSRDIQDNNTYSIIRNFNEEEVRELQKLDKYNIQVLNVLWKDLQPATKHVIESCFDFEDKPRAIEISLGEVLKHDSLFYGKLEFEITEEVIQEVRKYADYTKKIEIKEMLNSIMVLGVQLK